MRIAALLLILFVAAPSSSYRADVAKFRKDRDAEIRGQTGWAALVDLHWIDLGSYTIGRSPANAIVLNAPSAPAQLGVLTVRPDAVTLKIAKGIDARVAGAPVTEAVLQPNAGSAEGVTVGGMTMIVIKRGERLALRVWDTKSPARLAFHGRRWYAIDPKWRIDARFVPRQPVPRLKILNVLNDTVPMANPGYVEFRVAGQAYRLEALLESDDAQELFLMFKDATSSKTTYGAGRYLYTPLPKDGRVVVDFNRAENPPCAFTKFATCPLPPAANRLPLRITAGELDHK